LRVLRAEEAPARYVSPARLMDVRLAFIAHSYFGEAFGTLYDISTILILWFAGASALPDF
jgi:hypothetical protein